MDVMGDPTKCGSECELCNTRSEGKPRDSSLTSGSWREGEDDETIIYWTICQLCRAKLIGNAATIAMIAQSGNAQDIRSAINQMRSTLKDL